MGTGDQCVREAKASEVEEVKDGGCGDGRGTMWCGWRPTGKAQGQSGSLEEGEVGPERDG